MTRIAIVVVALVATLHNAGSLTAGESASTKHLSDGIVALYHGRNDLALLQFDLAQEEMARDPRLYFFRGVAKWRQGRHFEAEDDFRTGAHIEVALGRIDVGRALQRIQGAERLTLERFRNEARKLPREVVQRAVPPRWQESAGGSGTTGRPLISAARLPVVERIPADPSDPFREQAAGFLGRDDVPTAAREAEVATSDDPFGLRLPTGAVSAAESDSGEPIGTGVADFPPSGSDDARNAPTAEVDRDEDLLSNTDPFSIDGNDSRAASGPSGDDSPSVFGAAFRALTRGLAPALPGAEQGQQMLEQIGGFGNPETPPPAEDPFADPSSDGDASESTDGDPGDPFLDE